MVDSKSLYSKRLFFPPVESMVLNENSPPPLETVEISFGQIWILEVKRATTQPFNVMVSVAILVAKQFASSNRKS